MTADAALCWQAHASRPSWLVSTTNRDHSSLAATDATMRSSSLFTSCGICCARTSAERAGRIPLGRELLVLRLCSPLSGLIGRLARSIFLRSQADLKGSALVAMTRLRYHDPHFSAEMSGEDVKIRDRFITYIQSNLGHGCNPM